jgi:hypothetical protein
MSTYSLTDMQPTLILTDTRITNLNYKLYNRFIKRIVNA